MFAPTNDGDNVIWTTNYHLTDSSGAADTLAQCQGSDGNTSSFSQCFYDVTNTSTMKIYFSVASLAIRWKYNRQIPMSNNTCVCFIRLGDT
jgi:hypothetical protein